MAGMNQRQSANIWFAEGSPSRGHNLHTDFNTASVTQNAAQLRRRIGRPKRHGPADRWVILTQHHYGGMPVCSGDLGSLDLGSPRATAGSNARWI
jgi:hypothetical protein